MPPPIRVRLPPSSTRPSQEERVPSSAIFSGKPAALPSNPFRPSPSTPRRSISSPSLHTPRSSKRPHVKRQQQQHVPTSPTSPSPVKKSRPSPLQVKLSGKITKKDDVVDNTIPRESRLARIRSLDSPSILAKTAPQVEKHPQSSQNNPFAYSEPLLSSHHNSISITTTPQGVVMNDQQQQEEAERKKEIEGRKRMEREMELTFKAWISSSKAKKTQKEEEVAQSKEVEAADDSGCALDWEDSSYTSRGRTSSMESTFSHYASISSSDSETEVNSSSTRNDVFYAQHKMKTAHQGIFDTSINSPTLSSASSFEPFLPSFCWSKEMPVSSTSTSASMSYIQAEEATFPSDAAGKDVGCECLECDSSFIADSNLSLFLQPFEEGEGIEEEGDHEEAFPLSSFEKNNPTFLASHASELPSKLYLFPSPATAITAAHGGSHSSSPKKPSSASPNPSSSSAFSLSASANRFIGASPFPLPPRTSFKTALEVFEARLEISKRKSPYSHLASSSSRSGFALAHINDKRSAVDESITRQVEDEQAFPACQCGCESTFSPSSATPCNKKPPSSIQSKPSRHFPISPLTGLSKSIWSMASPTVSPRKPKKMISFHTRSLDLFQHQSDIHTASPCGAQDAFLHENRNEAFSQFPHGLSMSTSSPSSYRPLLKRSISGYPQHAHQHTSSMLFEPSYYGSPIRHHPQDQTPFHSYHHHHHQRIPVGPSPNNKKGELYKTEMCRSFIEFGHCRYAEKCQFAHGLAELRPLPYGFMPSHHHGHHHHSHSEAVAHRQAQAAMMPGSASALDSSGWDSSHRGLFDKASYAAEHDLFSQAPGEAFLGRRRSVSSPSKLRMYSLRDPFDFDDVDAVPEPAEGSQRTSMFKALQAEAMNAPKPVYHAHF